MPGTKTRSPESARAALCALLATVMLAGSAAAQTQLAILNVQEAISRTAEGQKLIRELEQKYRPTQQRLESKQNEINRMRDQLQKGANTMSQEALRNLNRDIQKAETAMQREVEDARGEFSQEQGQLFNEVGSKMMAIIDTYSKDNGFHIVLDISSPQSPVLYAVNEVNITNAIITAYDAAHPSGDAAPAN